MLERRVEVLRLHEGVGRQFGNVGRKSKREIAAVMWRYEREVM